MLRIVILGTGNLAKHLYDAFIKARDVDVVQVVGRNREDLQQFSGHATISNDFDAIADADVYLVAVKDDAIGEVSKYLSNKKGLVAHTSGAMGLNAIQTTNKGVFYPLQTFTKGKAVDFSNIPICMEAEEKDSLETLRTLATSISENVHYIDSDQRKKLHLAAVFVNNFTNYLYHVGEELCLEEGLSFELLKPLILETANKVQIMSPTEAQTGPARRNDVKSMGNHLELLNKEEHSTLYKLLSQAIKQAHEEEL
ncbi:Rossmann-like and DUF2520 domain-containing protein [Flagellimonas profundi]|uniref:DUF2520 domain-containing protein n=1 Tax=Flagellimonas profundi TaxID=2915620 RepID=A0ABS3FCL8_9FLAO|nr:Rossmann-like and DUF2520 domain-containing protein [Allomuricauda profundi]MBO0340778.1 DUF2520 domain-containing protein [Allomuricauda profundi]